MRLSKQKARKVSEAESTGPVELLEPGTYRAVLLSVDLAEGKKGPYWAWKYRVDEDGVPPRQLWNNTSLSEDSEWKLKETFDAFGVPADTDTDELEGESVLLQVEVRTIQQGDKTGQQANNIVAVLPFDEEAEDEEEEEAPPPKASPRSSAKAGAKATATKARRTTNVDDDDEDGVPF